MTPAQQGQFPAPPQIRAERLGVIGVLNIGNIVQIVLAEYLGSVDDQNKIGFRRDHRVDTGGHFALPTRPGHQVITRLAAGGQVADIADIVGKQVNSEIHRLVDTGAQRKSDHLRYSEWSYLFRPGPVQAGSATLAGDFLFDLSGQ